MSLASALIAELNDQDLDTLADLLSVTADGRIPPVTEKGGDAA